MRHLTPLRRLISASRSSGQRFAFASFIFAVARDTFAVRLTLPLTGRVEDFHL